MTILDEIQDRLITLHRSGNQPEYIRLGTEALAELLDVIISFDVIAGDVLPEGHVETVFGLKIEATGYPDRSIYFR